MSIELESDLQLSDDLAEALTTEKLNQATVIGKDHPLSQGHVVRLMTDHPFADASVRFESHIVRHLLGEAEACIVDADPPIKADWIIIGHAEPVVRLVELVAHEASHLVDKWFARAKVGSVDTELRSYYLDWVVGKLLHRFPLFLSESKEVSHAR